MNNASDEKRAGYRCPPKTSQWKKGQSGNPRGIGGRKIKSMTQMVEDAWAAEIIINENAFKDARPPLRLFCFSFG
jgi:Family of unknown function (DUF5681)